MPNQTDDFYEKFDANKIDEAVLALLYLNLHGDNYGDRVWKSFDWDAMDRLHEKGYISEPKGKAKSVIITEDGLAESKRLFEELFGRSQE